jgi:hypothetical protein
MWAEDREHRATMCAQIATFEQEPDRPSKTPKEAHPAQPTSQIVNTTNRFYAASQEKE